MNRDKLIASIRPEIKTVKSANQSTEEKFQNEVLRPILKLQHDILCALFLNNKNVIKSNFETKDITQKRAIVSNNLSANQQLKNQILYLIISLMTIPEYNHYMQNASSYNKRIISMATQRIIDGLGIDSDQPKA